MNKRIDHVIKHDRFPLSKMDWVFLIAIFTLIAVAAAFLITYYFSLLLLVFVLLFAALLCFSIYKGYIGSLLFKKINTGFSEEQNTKLVLYCMAKLNFKVYTDKEHANVFVCFVHETSKSDRQEIYIIAKESYVLINSSKEKDADNEPHTVDFLDKIGFTIYKTALDFRKQYPIK